tara:strand:+ start:88 stop:417 length:330 start_codon:yes stop_codon:yes gene_type:complete
MKTNYWTTKDGQQIAVEDLGAEHLSNILHMLERNNFSKSWLGQDMRFMRISDCINENREQLNLILGENKYIKVMTEREIMIDDLLDDIMQMHHDYHNGWCSEWDYILQS